LDVVDVDEEEDPWIGVSVAEAEDEAVPELLRPSVPVLAGLVLLLLVSMYASESGFLRQVMMFLSWNPRAIASGIT
jgi:hypothetical protein